MTQIQITCECRNLVVEAGQSQIRFHIEDDQKAKALHRMLQPLLGKPVPIWIHLVSEKIGLREVGLDTTLEAADWNGAEAMGLRFALDMTRYDVGLLQTLLGFVAIAVDLPVKLLMQLDSGVSPGAEQETFSALMSANRGVA
jgi:hypothetical protein